MLLGEHWEKGRTFSLKIDRSPLDHGGGGEASQNSNVSREVNELLGNGVQQSGQLVWPQRGNGCSMHLGSLTKMPRQVFTGRCTGPGSLVDSNEGGENHKSWDSETASHCSFPPFLIIMSFKNTLTLCKSPGA